MLYLAYVKANFKFPQIAAFIKDVFMLVMPDSKYAERVPIQIRSIHIDLQGI